MTNIIVLFFEPLVVLEGTNKMERQSLRVPPLLTWRHQRAELVGGSDGVGVGGLGSGLLPALSLGLRHFPLLPVRDALAVTRAPCVFTQVPLQVSGAVKQSCEHDVVAFRSGTPVELVEPPLLQRAGAVGAVLRLGSAALDRQRLPGLRSLPLERARTTQWQPR